MRRVLLVSSLAAAVLTAALLAGTAGVGVVRATVVSESRGGVIAAGTTNVIPKYTGATVLDDSLASDDGTTLSYTGTGGVSTPKFTATDATGNSTLNGTLNYCADAGASDTYACNLSPALTAYATGACYVFKANTANTGAATINLNSLGAKTIKKFTSASPGADLADNDIRAGQNVQVCYDGTNMQIVSPLGNGAAATTATVNTYTASDTWSKPSNCTVVYIVAIGGGGGGGSGRRGAAASVRGGGGGGGAAAYSYTTMPCSSLGATETVTIAAGGTAGAAVTADDTDGNNGGNGGNTTFGTSTTWLFAGGGEGGGRGTNAGSTAGLGDFAPGTEVGKAGSASSSTGGAGSQSGTTNSRAAAPGSPGGGVTSGDAESAGGTGGNKTAPTYGQGGAGLSAARTIAGGTAGTSSGGAGGAGANANANEVEGGGGGGGGGSQNDGVGAGGTGGAGGSYGGGGGGGGASTNGANSGAGGAGGPGILMVIAYP